MMSGITKIRCLSCQQNTQKYRTYYDKPHCTECCSKLSVATILSIMDITYHEAISTKYRKVIKKGTNIILLEHLSAVFWCTENNNSEILRYGVSYRTPIKIDENDKYITIVVAYHWNNNGIHDMNKLKVNFKRIRSGKPYMTY
jgi:hypothetical protein